MGTDRYYEKFFPDGVDGNDSEEHMLHIRIKDEVTPEMLTAAGLVAGDEFEGDFYINEDGQPLIELCLPLAAENGELPADWDLEVPSLICLKPEWVDSINVNG